MSVMVGTCRGALAGVLVRDAEALAALRAGGLRVVMVTGDSRATLRSIRRNLFFAFAYDTLGVPFAAGVLHPFFRMVVMTTIPSRGAVFMTVVPLDEVVSR